MVLTCKVSPKPHDLHAAVEALSAIHVFVMFCYNFLELSELSKKVVFRGSQMSSVVFVTGKDGFLRYHSFFFPQVIDVISGINGYLLTRLLSL